MNLAKNLCKYFRRRFRVIVKKEGDESLKSYTMGLMNL